MNFLPPISFSYRPPVNAAATPPASNEQQQQPDSRLAEVAQEFEAIFISLLIKQMRAGGGEGLFPGDQSDIYGGLFDEHLGRALSQGGMLRLGEHLETLTETKHT